MEHDRFDDVEVRFLPDSELPPGPPRRRRRWVVAAAATALLAGGLAAGASAVGSGDDAAAPAAEKQRLSYPEAGRPHMREGRPCEANKPYGGHRRDREASELRY